MIATPAGFKAYTAKKRGKKKNGLWGDAKGKYKTSGKGGSATVRGTRWYVANYANGSLFKVSKGSVTIDPIRGKNFVLKAGKQFFIFYKRGK
jgi:ferric-dicitrate binding protein FerR (iron transport regulator)